MMTNEHNYDLVLKKLTTEMRWRIFFSVAAFHIFTGALEEILIRWYNTHKGREELLKVFNEYFELVADRPTWLPWFILLVGAFVMISIFFSKLRIED